jgi:hypothetical protein
MLGAKLWKLFKLQKFPIHIYLICLSRYGSAPVSIFPESIFQMIVNQFIFAIMASLSILFRAYTN